MLNPCYSRSGPQTNRVSASLRSMLERHHLGPLPDLLNHFAFISSCHRKTGWLKPHPTCLKKKKKKASDFWETFLLIVASGLVTLLLLCSQHPSHTPHKSVSPLVSAVSPLSVPSPHPSSSLSSLPRASLRQRTL